MKKILFLLFSIALFAGCSESKNLEISRKMLERARNCPEVKKFALAELNTAESAYAKAETSGNADDIYVAERKAESALAAAKTKVRENANALAKTAYDEKLAALEKARKEEEKAKQAEIDKLKADLAEKERLLKEKEAEQERMQKELEDAVRGMGEVKKEERGLVVYFSDILFDFNKADLRPASVEGLGKLSATLEKNMKYKIKIEGHTDSIGTDDYNMKLSVARALAVKSFLLAHNIAADRLTTEGFGETKPMATNKTAEGRQKIRRVEMVIEE